MPRLGKSKRNGKTSYNLQVRTRSYSFLKEIYDVFYIKKNGKKYIKIIPQEIFFLLNPISMAF